MAKRSKLYRTSVKRVKTLRLTKDVNLKFTGPITGDEYYFQGAGSTLEVNEDDANKMLMIRKPKSCCNPNIGGYPLFELVS